MAFILIGAFFSKESVPPRKADDRHIMVYGHKIRYRDTGGDKPALVFLHSFGENLEMWDPITKRLDGFRVIALDMIGFGGSDRPFLEYNLETAERYLLGFFDALGLRKAVLIGSSMGGSIAVWTAGNLGGERVGALVLFAPSGFPGSLQHRFPLNHFYRPGPWNTLGRRIVNTPLFQRVFPDSLARQGLGMTGSYNRSYRDILKNITQPALLVWSRGDRRVLYKFADEYMKSMPNVRLVEYPDEAGHGVAHHQPVRTVEHITQFLDMNRLAFR